MKTIKIEYVYFEITDKEMSVQLSDEKECAFCGAYELFDANMTPHDWHNF